MRASHRVDSARSAGKTRPDTAGHLARGALSSLEDALARVHCVELAGRFGWLTPPQLTSSAASVGTIAEL